MADLSVARSTGIEGFERHVVIKHLRPDQSEDAAFVQMFLTEARLAGALHHHNIVQVHDIGQDNGTHFFAMEYVHGEDLRHMLSRLSRRDEQPPFEHVVTIITSAAAALHHAHEQKGADRQPLGIVHRDVTPANIIIAYDGNVKVVDFGIAKATIQTIKTQTGTLKGKVPYMSPEQCTGKAIDRRSDVFALGIVLYELTTTRRLFKGNNEFYVMSAVISGEIPPPSQHRKDLPKELEKIILKALSRKPSDRYQTADEMRYALESFAENAGLRTSASSLAAFMKKLFGERPEPWTKEAKDSTNENDIDFDSEKTETGVVEIPPEVIEKRVIPKAVATTRGSLIEQARLNAISSDLEVITSAPKPRTKTPLPSLVNKPESKPESNGKRAPLPAPTKPADRPEASGRKPVERAASEDASTVVKTNGAPIKTNGVAVKTPGHVQQPTVPLRAQSDLARAPTPTPFDDASPSGQASETPYTDQGETDLDATELSGPPVLVADLAPVHKAITTFEKTDVANPPPPPLPPGVVEGSLPERDPTAIVKPLPVPNSRAKSQVLLVPTEGDEDTANTSKLDKRWLLAGGIAIVALAVAIIVVMTGSKDLSKPHEMLDLKAQAATNAAASEPTPVEPTEVKPAEPTEVKPAEPAEVKPAEVKPAEVKPAEVKPAEPAEVKPAEPAEVKPAEVKPAEVKPAEVNPTKVAAKPAPRPIRRPVKTATKPKPKPTKPANDPKWDPNALFLKKKP